jgi:RNA polymerase-binding protein DksA
VDLDAARDRLVAERTRVLAEMQAWQDDLSHSIEDAMDEDGNDSHLADSATETVDREIEQTLEDNAEHLLASIDAALGRIEDGSYGRCDRCGEAIADERLEALPYATKCIECKRLEERG